MMTETLNAMRAWMGSPSQFASATGATCLLLGGVLLAFAASGELQAHRIAIRALQLETATLIDAVARGQSNSLVKVTGTDIHMGSGTWWNTRLTWCGILLLFVAFVLTVWAVFLACP